MKQFKYPVIFIGCLILAVSAILACKQKTAKLIVFEHKFSIRKDHENSYAIDARGKIKNVGEVDVKKVVVAGYCKACETGFAPRTWSSSEREKATEEKCTINFIPAGGEADFYFTNVAIMYNNEEPKEMPEKMEVAIESFEIVK
jgi:hypothetical protein